MADLIDRLSLGNRMYHEAFEKDSDMQKWDSGCWIRYKLFENVLRDTPSVDAVEVVRCKDCKHHEEINQPYPQLFCRKHSIDTLDDDYCSSGERNDG